MAKQKEIPRTMIHFFVYLHTDKNGMLERTGAGQFHGGVTVKKVHIKGMSTPAVNFGSAGQLDLYEAIEFLLVKSNALHPDVTAERARLKALKKKKK